MARRRHFQRNPKIMKKFLSVILVSLLISGSQATKISPNAANNDLETLTRDYLPEQFTKSNFTLEDAKTLLYKKCKKAAVTSANPTQTYEKIAEAANKLQKCTNSIANITEMIDEIESARPLGDLDVVFHKYCSRVPLAEKCLLEFNAQILPCLSSAERVQNSIMMRILTSMLGFICHKNGDQIALFIAEQGPQCLEANKKNIQHCMNAAFSTYHRKGVAQLTPYELPELVLGSKQCIDLHDFEGCVLSYLEKCNEITPANIIESLFRHVKNETKCQEEIDKVISFQRNQVQQQHNKSVNYTLWLTFYFATFMMGLGVFLMHYF